MPTFDTPQPIAVTVDVPAGRVLVRATDRTQTVVEVVPTNEAESADVRVAEQARVEYADGRLTVRAPKSKNKLRSLFGRPGSVDVTLDLPSGSHLDATVWGDVRSQGRLGDTTVDTAAGWIRLDETGRVHLRSAAGDVSVSRVTGSAEATTASGKIRIGDVDGHVVAKTSNGDVTLVSATGDVRLNTANGDIDIERASTTVAAKTAYGSVRVGEVTRGKVVIATAFGEIEVGIREGTAAWLDASSKYGNLRSDLDAAGEPEPSAERVEIRAHTGFGDVVVRRVHTAQEGTA